MARYIDENEVYFLIGERGIAKIHCSQIDELPRADVVPKSEVEQLKWERDVAIKQLEEIGLSFGEKTDGYGNLTEYAREIFKRIYERLELFIRHRPLNPIINNMLEIIEEVEKKYTESEDKE